MSLLRRFDHLLNGQQKRFEEIDTHKEKIRELEKSQTESTEEHMRILNDVKNHYVTSKYKSRISTQEYNMVLCFYW